MMIQTGKYKVVTNSKPKYLLLTLTAIFILTSCIELGYRTETDARYREHIGKRFEVQQTVALSGVRGSNNIIDYVTLSTNYKSGPEIGFNSNVLVGSIIEVIEVERCMPCLTLELRLVLRFLKPESLEYEHLVLDSFSSGILSLSGNKDILIDSRYLKEVNSD